VKTTTPPVQNCHSHSHCIHLPFPLALYTPAIPTRTVYTCHSHPHCIHLPFPLALYTPAIPTRTVYTCHSHSHCIHLLFPLALYTPAIPTRTVYTCHSHSHSIHLPFPLALYTPAIPTPTVYTCYSHSHCIHLLFPLALYTPRPLSSTEVENDLQNAKHKRIPSESTDSCLPAVLLSLFTSTGPPSYVEQCLCVFSSHCLCLHCMNFHQPHRSETDMPNSSFCTAFPVVLSHVIPSDQQTVLRYKM
jgi:hypothetical protein